MSAAATFSSRWATLEVPGIGSMTGLRLSSQASAISDASDLVALGDRFSISVPADMAGAAAAPTG